jgi:hypothetical protein
LRIWRGLEVPEGRLKLLLSSHEPFQACRRHAYHLVIRPTTEVARYYRVSLRDMGFVRRPLKQLFLSPQVSEGPNICQCEVEAELVFIANRAQGKAPIFNA